MNIILASIISIIYIMMSIQYYYNHNYGMFIVFCAYSIANMGLFIAGGFK